MTQLTVSEILIDASRTAIEKQNKDTGELPAGHNGPYHDPETPVRNTSHWLITFLKCYEWTRNNEYLEAAKKAVEYLLSNRARPNGATYYHRKAPGKDGCNGLVGQAWTIEALAVAAGFFDETELLAQAEEVFLLHPFYEPAGIWKRVEVDGSILSYDPTFNHQLWFAAAGALLAQYDEVDQRVGHRVECFLDKVNVLLRTYDSGLIFHALLPRFRPKLYAGTCLSDEQFNYVKTAVGASLPLSNIQTSLRKKAIGYHSFNMYAFAVLYKVFPEHPWWKSMQFDNCLKYMSSDIYCELLSDNPYGYPYNPPGFEVPYTEYVFHGTVSNRGEQYLQEQLSRSYDPKANTLSRRTEDPVTMTARLYQATRLPELTVSLSDTT
ncbi:agl cluster protein AglQ [Natronosalvus vescus]|uniref:agl cluster protein AglQ n=1 Tax=Natronosalvus vescus TaxID=2953881 RepID=UPI0020919DDB|nr:agl cluster protein AglQ [Natronosalvus vescus]